MEQGQNPDTSFRFVITPEYGSKAGEYVFFQAETAAFFQEWKVESKANHNIFLHLSINNLTRAIQSGSSSDKISIRLSKKAGNAILAFEMISTTSSTLTSSPDQYQTQFNNNNNFQNQKGQEVKESLPSFSQNPSHILPPPHFYHLTQDVPVIVLPPSAADAAAEPDLSIPTVRLYAPPLKQFSSVCEKLISINPIVDVIMEEGAGGRIILQAKANNQYINLAVYFNQLNIKQPIQTKPIPSSSNLISSLPTPPTPISNPPNNRIDSPPSPRVELSISAEKLFHVLACRTLNLLTVIACAVEGECFILYAKLREGRGTLTYFIPIIQK